MCVRVVNEDAGKRKKEMIIEMVVESQFWVEHQIQRLLSNPTWHPVQL